MYSPKFIIPKHSPKISSVIAANISLMHTSAHITTNLNNTARMATNLRKQPRKTSLHI